MSQTVFNCIDSHACGNPVRVVTTSAPKLEGGTMSERRQYFLKRYDWIRTSLMFEPRGHDAMSGSILYPPINTNSDAAVLFIEVSGCLPMCGHGTIGTVTVALEENLVTPTETGVLRLDTPAGLVEARYESAGKFIESVKLTNVPSFCHSTDIMVNIPGMGDLHLDVSYGGNFYAIIESQKNYSDLDDISIDQIRQLSPLIRNQLNQKYNFVHPLDNTIREVSHIMWTGKPKSPKAHARNAVFYGDRGIDRSPCGTGTSARMAQLTARGDLSIGAEFINESVIGSLFTGSPISSTRLADHQGIIPTIEGWARVTGHNNIIVDRRDPYAHGFLLI